MNHFQQILDLVSCQPRRLNFLTKKFCVPREPNKPTTNHEILVSKGSSKEEHSLINIHIKEVSKKILTYQQQDRKRLATNIKNYFFTLATPITRQIKGNMTVKSKSIAWEILMSQ